MSTADLRKALRRGNLHEQAVAAIELGRRSDTASTSALRGLMDASDDLVAVSSMFGCWLLGLDPVPVERAVASLASSDEETVQLAVQALCEMGERVVPDLIKLLEAGSPHSVQVLRILGDIGGTQGFEAVKRTALSATPQLAAVARAVLSDWENADKQ